MESSLVLETRDRQFKSVCPDHKNQFNMKKVIVFVFVVLVAILLFIGGKRVLTIASTDNAQDTTTVAVDTVVIDSVAITSPDSID